MLPELVHNQIVGGGLVLMGTGAVMGLLRSMPGKIIDWLKQRFTVSITVVDRDPLFEWTKLWLDTLPYAKKARNVVCSLQRSADEEFDANESRTVFVPGYGDHFFKHNGRYIWLSRNKKDSGDGSTATPAVKGSAPQVESISFTILGSDQRKARELIHDIVQSVAVSKQQTRGYISGSGWWRRLPTFTPRLLETVDIPKEDETRIVQAIERFLDARKDYAKKGIPYHLNFLFEGLAGTGKTSLASALCGHFNLHLHLLNIAGPGMNDDRLVQLMLDLPRRSILLLEDVDCLVPERKFKPKSPKAIRDSTDDEEEKENAPSGVTLSGLLNCMDGITAPDGAVIILTTNHPEVLDPALTRPGRIDMRVAFKAITKDQIERMCARLNPGLDITELANKMVADGLTAAQVQAELLAR